MANKKAIKHLSEIERGKIEIMLKKGDSIAKIARELKRHYNTIYREVKKAQVMQIKSGKKIMVYYADTAQLIYSKNKKRAVNKYKLIYHMDFIKLLEKFFFKNSWSIAACVGYIKKNYKNVNSLSVSTVYSYISKGLLNIKNHNLPEKLNRKKKTRPRKTKEHKRILGTSIDKRPDISARKEFGHWEVDTIVGKKTNPACLVTLVERKTRKAVVLKSPSRKSKDVSSTVLEAIKRTGKKNFKSLTFDNGSEFASVSNDILENGVPVQAYFAHPYSSWERGTNERTNRLVRYFVKKGEDISKYSDSYIKDVENWINTLPRLILDWDCAQDKFKEYAN